MLYLGSTKSILLHNATGVNTLELVQRRREELKVFQDLAPDAPQALC